MTGGSPDDREGGDDVGVRRHLTSEGSSGDTYGAGPVRARDTGDGGGEVTDAVAVEPAAGVVDFASAAALTIADLRARVGMDSWLVARRRGDDYVVLAAAEDDPYGNHVGLVRPWEETYCARMVDGSAPAVAPDVDASPGYARMRDVVGIPAGAYLSVPLHAPDGELLGTLCAAGHARQGDDLVAAMPTIRLQAGLLATVLSHELQLEREVRRRERAESAAATDALTGVANRRAWDAALAAEDARADRYATQACVVVLDLDALKGVNDGEGHAAGDALLRRTAELLRGRVRASDLLARLGGDEFGVLLPETSPEDAATVGRLLAAHLADHGIAASVGVGARGRDDLHAAWRAADAAMYTDKASRGSPERSRPTGPRAAAPAATEGTSLSGVDALLRLLRDQLDMDAAYVTRIDGEERTFRNISSRVPLPLRTGTPEPSDGTYCDLVVRGLLDEVVPDTAAHPLAAGMPATRSVGVGAYVGVPLRRSDGRLYGTLCTHSRTADHRLRPRDAEVLRSLGRVVMELVEEEDRREDGRAALLRDLDTLATDGGPRTLLQPGVELATGQVVGAEALSRFPGRDPSPAPWFRRAARAGATLRLDLLCLGAALQHVGRLPVPVGVNASPSTVLTPAFTRLLGDGPLEGLVVELTEHEQVEDYTSLTAVLRPLRARGLRVAVDDAGAGFASLRHVVRLEPDVLKIDMSLVRGIDRSAGQSAMAGALLGFADETGAATVAEGVETEAERDHLVALGVRYGQGDLLGRPVPAEEFAPG